MGLVRKISYDLDEVLEQACTGKLISPGEIEFLLGLQEDDHLAQLFLAARSVRDLHFHRKVFLYGFVYFSTWCRNDCAFCYYRKSNGSSKRYRKSDEEILDAAGRLAESGVHLIDLTLGEDPFFYHNKDGFNYLANLVKKVKTETRLTVMASPGVVPRESLKLLAEAGADWYACYQETHNRELFNRLRLGQSYDSRFISKRLAIEAGMLVEEGILVGVGESLRDIVVSTRNMRLAKASQVRVMGFVPQEGTPMVAWVAPPRKRELVVIAVLRLLFPDRLIPASLDVDGVEGLQARVNAGANVITSLIPPRLGLAGVAQNSKDINEGYRTVAGILPLLEEMDLVVATKDEYASWLEIEKERLKKEYACLADARTISV